MNSYTHKISTLVSPDNWRGGELHLEALPGESAEQLMDRAAKMHEEWFKKKYGVPEVALGLTQQSNVVDIQIDKATAEQRIDMLISDMQTCKSIKVLESYRLLAKTHPRLQEAYDRHYELLV